MCEIVLTQEKVAIVDDEDYTWAARNRWFAHRDHRSHSAFYAYRTDRSSGKVQTIILHRVIIGAKFGEVVDHINGDTLDCRRSNLRVCQPGQNRANSRKYSGSSRFKGVAWNKSKKKWAARIRHKRKCWNLGAFDNPEDAARAYDEKAAELHGPYALTNKDLGLIDGDDR